MQGDDQILACSSYPSGADGAGPQGGWTLCGDGPEPDWLCTMMGTECRL